MDKATRAARRRIKAQRTPRGQISPFEARGMGRKNRPANTFPTVICDHVEGGKKVPVRKRRKAYPNETYVLMVLVGGVRCSNPADVTKPDGTRRCLNHISS